MTDNVEKLAERRAMVLNPKAPLDCAAAFIDSCPAPLRRYHGVFYEWAGARYRPLDHDHVTARLYAFLNTVRRPAGGGTAPFQPTRAKVGDVAHALAALVELPAHLEAPAWLDGEEHPPAIEILACQNGLLHLPTGNLLRHTPAFFSTAAVEFAHDPNAPAPAEWFKFLHSVWGSDTESIETLQEMFGYLLTADTKHQKIFLLVGPKRSGKGTIGGVIVQLVGRDAVAAPTLASLARNFGLWPLIDKSVAIVPDARLRGGSHEIIERLLAISGGDILTVDRKHLPAWTGRLLARLLFLTNVVPVLADAGSAIVSRFIVLQMTVSFYGKEDLQLAVKLRAELPAILGWAIAGWRRLEKRGHFKQPESAQRSIDLLEELSNPIKAFVDESCVLDPKGEIRCDFLFAAWKVWCQNHGREHPGNDASLGRALHAVIPGLRRERHRVGADATLLNPTKEDEERPYVYVGLRWKRPEEIDREGIRRAAEAAREDTAGRDEEPEPFEF